MPLPVMLAPHTGTYLCLAALLLIPGNSLGKALEHGQAGFGPLLSFWETQTWLLAPSFGLAQS